MVLLGFLLASAQAFHIPAQTRTTGLSGNTKPSFFGRAVAQRAPAPRATLIASLEDIEKKLIDAEKAKASAAKPKAPEPKAAKAPAPAPTPKPAKAPVKTMAAPAPAPAPVVGKKRGCGGGGEVSAFVMFCEKRVHARTICAAGMDSNSAAAAFGGAPADCNVIDIAAAAAAEGDHSIHVHIRSSPISPVKECY